MATARTLTPSLDSAELARRLALNPHNFGGPLHMCAHDYAAAQFEAEGRKGYPHGRNPYNVGTMANDRWAAGWHQSDSAEAR